MYENKKTSDFLESALLLSGDPSGTRFVNGVDLQYGKNSHDRQSERTDPEQSFTGKHSS